MPLKDLVADRSKVTEEMIETIIADYVRYDPDAYEIIMTPAGSALGNDAKVLVVLVAALGWQYVVDETRSIATTPASLGELTGIPGGTLRPVLKKLKDLHLVSKTDGHYAARAANLDAIGRTVAGGKATAPVKRSTTGKAKATAAKAAGGQSKERQAGKTRHKSAVPISATLDRLVNEGFFTEIRTLSQVVARLHELAVIAKTTSLSGPIAGLVREDKLKRKKVKHGTREVWGYQAN